MNTFSALAIRTARHPNFPLILLLAVSLVAGLLTFQDYSLSWDEPLFYAYADAIPYAYSISERLSGDFNIENAYGPSAEDHKIYGPAYLLPAKVVVDLLDWALPVQPCCAMAPGEFPNLPSRGGVLLRTLPALGRCLGSVWGSAPFQHPAAFMGPRLD